MCKLIKMTKFTLSGILAATLIMACNDPARPGNNGEESGASEEAATDEQGGPGPDQKKCPAECKKDPICENNQLITYTGTCSEDDDNGCVFTANEPMACSEGCKSDQSGCNGECSSHDDCATDFYCDKNGSRKCQPQKDNGDAVSDASDPHICKSNIISADGYCCDTVCDSSTECDGECAVAVSSYSCASGRCLFSDTISVPVENGKICVDNQVVPLSAEHNCGAIVKGNNMCATTVYYRACSQNGSCRIGEDLTDALSDLILAPQNYYFASDSTTDLVEGAIRGDCTTDNSVVYVDDSTCDGSGLIFAVGPTCKYGCANGKCLQPTEDDCGICERLSSVGICAASKVTASCPTYGCPYRMLSDDTVLCCNPKLKWCCDPSKPIPSGTYSGMYQCSKMPNQ